MMNVDEQELENNAENADSVSRNLQRQFSEGDFTCGCCYELMVQPTTLTCGHSFCRICLATWYFQSKKKECPSCRQPWYGSPKINVILRNLAEKAFEKRLKEREDAILTQQNHNTIERFEKALESSNNSRGQNNAAGNLGRLQQLPFGGRHRNFNIKKILFVAFLVFGIFLMHWDKREEDILVRKPVERWNKHDVGEWLFNLGEWAQPYSELAKELKLDGRLILALDEEDLQNTLNVSNVLHKKAIINSIEMIKKHGMKPPNTLWEYKAVYPERALKIIFGLKDYPRTFMLYLYLRDYEEVLLPWAVALKKKPFDQEIDGMIEIPTEDTSMVSLLVDFFLLPYVTVVKYAYGYMAIHYWISRCIILNCVLKTILEASHLRKIFARGFHRRHLKETLKIEMKGYLKGVGILVFFAIILPAIPSFLCNLFFYAALYGSPFYHLIEIRKVMTT